MRSLAEVLSKKHFDEPPEVKIIKKYVRDKFQEDVVINVKPKQIMIVAPNAALAGTLRMHLNELTELCKTSKRFMIVIG